MLAIVLLAAGCGGGPQTLTPQQVVAALRAHGVQARITHRVHKVVPLSEVFNKGGSVQALNKALPHSAYDSFYPRGLRYVVEDTDAESPRSGDFVSALVFDTPTRARAFLSPQQRQRLGGRWIRVANVLFVTSRKHERDVEAAAAQLG